MQPIVVSIDARELPCDIHDGNQWRRVSPNWGGCRAGQDDGHGTDAFEFANNAATVSPNANGVRVTRSNGLDTTASAGDNARHNVVQRTPLCNYIMRVV